jgi:hypothetical protein
MSTYKLQDERPMWLAADGLRAHVVAAGTKWSHASMLYRVNSE